MQSESVLIESSLAQYGTLRSIPPRKELNFVISSDMAHIKTPPIVPNTPVLHKIKPHIRARIISIYYQVYYQVLVLRKNWKRCEPKSVFSGVEIMKLLFQHLHKNYRKYEEKFHSWEKNKTIFW